MSATNPLKNENLPFSHADYALLCSAINNQHPLTKEVAQAAERLFSTIRAGSSLPLVTPLLQELAFKVRSLSLEGTKWGAIDRICSAIINALKDFCEGKEVKMTSSASRLLGALERQHLEWLVIDLETEANLQIAEFLSLKSHDSQEKKSQLEKGIAQIQYTMEQISQVDSTVNIKPLMSLCEMIIKTIDSKNKQALLDYFKKEIDRSAISHTDRELKQNIQKEQPTGKTASQEDKSMSKCRQSKYLLYFILEQYLSGTPFLDLNRTSIITKAIRKEKTAQLEYM